MTVDLDRMRWAYFAAVAWSGWPAEDWEEIGAEIRMHVEAGNEEALAYWAARLEELAGWGRLTVLCRAAEARIHAAALARAEKERQAA